MSKNFFFESAIDKSIQSKIFRAVTNINKSFRLNLQYLHKAIQFKRYFLLQQISLTYHCSPIDLRKKRQYPWNFF